MDIILTPRIYMLVIWFFLTMFIMFRGAVHGDISRDISKNLKVWEFYRKDTSIATKLLLPSLAVWIIMWFLPLKLTITV